MHKRTSADYMPPFKLPTDATSCSQVGSLMISIKKPPPLPALKRVYMIEPQSSTRLHLWQQASEVMSASKSTHAP